MNRNDKILERFTDFVTGWVVEKFDHGRSKSLKGESSNVIISNQNVIYF